MKKRQVNPFEPIKDDYNPFEGAENKYIVFKDTLEIMECLAKLSSREQIELLDRCEDYTYDPTRLNDIGSQMLDIVNKLNTCIDSLNKEVIDEEILEHIVEMFYRDACGKFKKLLPYWNDARISEEIRYITEKGKFNLTRIDEEMLTIEEIYRLSRKLIV